MVPAGMAPGGDWASWPALGLLRLLRPFKALGMPRRQAALPQSPAQAALAGAPDPDRAWPCSMRRGQDRAGPSLQRASGCSRPRRGARTPQLSAGRPRRTGGPVRRPPSLASQRTLPPPAWAWCAGLCALRVRVCRGAATPRAGAATGGGAAELGQRAAGAVQPPARWPPFGRCGAAGPRAGRCAAG